MHKLTLVPVLAAALAVLGPPLAAAQPVDLLLPQQASPVANGAPPVAPGRQFATRSRKARIDVAALQARSIRLALFDDIQPILDRESWERPSADTLVWVGKDAFGAQAVLTASRGIVSGTVFADHRTFEIAMDPDGEYRITELDSAAFPTDDPDFDEADMPVPEAPDLNLEAQGAANRARNDDVSDVTAADTVAFEASTTTSLTTLSTTPIEIAVMIVWTPRAETAAGGRSAMDALALNAVANANLVYANSGLATRLKLVYRAPVSYTENTSSISTDLSNLRGTSDGKLDSVHTLRNQYAADIVTLIGDGYTSFCGIGSLMTTVSTSFASAAFNVVSRACALGNLSYAHEVGHNQGLQHNPQNAGSTPSQPYAYGYQDPSGYFRTVLSYGSAKRIPYLSSPRSLYNSRVTGTSSQDNARALATNASVVAAFRGSSTTTTTSPACAFTLSVTSLVFPSSGGSKSLSVSAPSGCAWLASESSSWLVLNRTSGSGSGTVTVTVAPHTGGSNRNTSVKVAGQSVAVKQKAAY